MKMTFLSRIRYRMLAKIFVLIAVVISLMVALLSNLLYREFRSEGLQSTYRYNQQVLEQLSYNIESMNESIKSFMVTLFRDSDNEFLMYNDGQDNADYNFLLQRALNRFQKTVASNSMISSAALFNRSRNTVYTTFGWSTIAAAADVKWEQSILEHYKSMPMLTPIPTLLSEGAVDEEREVFTYVLYDPPTGSGKPIDGALIVNVKTDVLRNNLIKYGGDTGRLYILDSRKRVILDSGRQGTMFEPFDAPYLPAIEQNPQKGKSFLSSDLVITYFPIERTNWIMVTEAPYETEFASLRHMREKTLLYTLVCLLGGLLISFFLAKKIYSPFGNLVHKVRENLLDRLPDAVEHKESELLASALDYSMRTIRDYDSYKGSTKDLLQENRLKAELTGDSTLAAGDLAAAEDEGRVPFLLVIFRPDQDLHYEELGEEEKRLLYFSVTNIADDALGEISPFRKTAMGDGTFVYLLERDPEPAMTDERIDLEPIRHAQSIIRRITPGITVSAAVARIRPEEQSLHHMYRNTIKLFDFQIFYGLSCLLQQAMIRDRLRRGDLDMPQERTEKLIDAVKSGHREEAEEQFDAILSEVSQGDVNQLYGLLTRLVLVLYREVQELNAHLVEPVELKVNAFTNEMMSQLAMDGIRGQFMKLFASIIEKANVQTVRKHNYLVNAIVDFIRLDYSNEDLSLKKIASEFKMSAAYVGQIFRESMNQSVADYIHKVRLDKVSERLRMTDDSIKQIISDVGYTNETNFYKLFKKVYGITPNDYRQNIALMRKE